MSEVPPPSSHHLGRQALRALGDQIAAGGGRRTLLVTGRRSFTDSGAEEQLAQLVRSANVQRWSDVSPNTDVDELHEGLQIVDSFRPDYILGVGGGSVMDMAKLLCAYPSDVTKEQLVDRIERGDHLADRTVGLGLAPTTSGSGSEATHFAVVYIGDAKYSVAGPALRADSIALDPQLPASGSPHQRATSGMDAVCQAIESRWATGGTGRSRRYADFALTTLLRSIRPFVDGDDSYSPAMQFGSHLAGRAIDISKTTAAHALSYAITKTYGVDHGNAAALTLGCFIEDHATRPERELPPSVDPVLHRAAMGRILGALGATDGASGRTSFTALLRDVGLPSSLTDVGSLSDDDLERLAGSVNTQRLANNPFPYDQDDLVKILQRAAERSS